MYILFEKLKALPSGNILCFVETGVSQKGPPSLCDQFGGEAIVELSRFHAAFVLDRVDFWGCHTLKMRIKRVQYQYDKRYELVPAGEYLAMQMRPHVFEEGMLVTVRLVIGDTIPRYLHNPPGPRSPKSPAAPARKTHAAVGTGCGQISANWPRIDVHHTYSSLHLKHGLHSPLVLHASKSTDNNILAALTRWIVLEHQLLTKTRVARVARAVHRAEGGRTGRRIESGPTTRPSGLPSLSSRST